MQQQHEMTTRTIATIVTPAINPSIAIDPSFLFFVGGVEKVTRVICENENKFSSIFILSGFLQFETFRRQHTQTLV